MTPKSEKYSHKSWQILYLPRLHVI